MGRWFCENSQVILQRLIFRVLLSAETVCLMATIPTLVPLCEMSQMPDSHPLALLSEALIRQYPKIGELKKWKFSFFC